MDLYLRHPLSGATKKAPQGFSWTTLLFGLFVPLLRGDWKFVGLGLLAILVGIVTAGIVILIYWIVVAFKYNEWYATALRERGYVEITL